MNPKQTLKEIPQDGMSKFRRYFHVAPLQDVYACIRVRTHSVSSLSLYIYIFIIFRSVHSITHLIWDFTEAMSCIAMGEVWPQSSISCHQFAGGVVSEANSGILIRGLVVPDLLIPLKIFVSLIIRR